MSNILEPQRFLQRVAPEFCDILAADRIGVAQHVRTERRFENVALWDRADAVSGVDREFSAAGTAASWIVEHAYPVVGQSLHDMKPYPSTLAYLVRERFGSNLLLPLDLGRFGEGVLYMLARTPGTFSHTAIPAGLRVREIVEPALRAHAATREFVEGADETERATPRGDRPTDTTDMTLAAAQRRHIVDVLTRTNWIIEGPRGAAETLGLHPSTLRHRMRKLGVSRPD